MPQVVLICCPVPEFASDIAVAADAGEMQPSMQADPQEFGSQLYRDQDSIGILWTAGPAGAAMMVRDFRRGQITNPIIVLIEENGSVSRRSQDRALVLKAGADDAQPASIDILELMHRMKAIVRRGRFIDHLNIQLPGCVYDAESGMVEGDGKKTHLTPTEGRVLQILARDPDRVFSKDDIMDKLYGDIEEAPERKIVDVLVCKLRHKLADMTGGKDVVQTIWGRGYQFAPEGFEPRMRSDVRVPR